MKILYLSSSYIPSRRANSIQVMNMCHALARQGHAVRLVSKNSSGRLENGRGDDFAFYGLSKTFEIVKFNRPPRPGGGIVYAWAMDRLLNECEGKVDLVCCRDLIGALRATQRKYKILFEAHSLPTDFFAQSLFRYVMRSPQLVRLVTNSGALRDELLQRRLVDEQVEIRVAHNGSEIHDPEPSDGFTLSPSFPKKGPHLGYVGQLYVGRGIEILVQLARLLPDCTMHIIGGNEKDIAHWKSAARLENLVFHGFVPPGELPNYYQRLDVLLMPYQNQVYSAVGREDSSRYMSPIKMFEYMGTGKPIVSSNHAVLQEVLKDGENALLVAPDDVGAWESAVRRILNEPGLGRRLGENARRGLMEHYTWDARARNVLDGIAEKIGV